MTSMLRRRSRSQSDRSRPPSSVFRAGWHSSSSSDMTMICAWVAAGGKNLGGRLVKEHEADRVLLTHQHHGERDTRVAP